ncbi:MAG: type II secretion system protein [Fimbriimonas sp.]
MKRTQAFTLVEILAVLAIIAVLAALLFPVAAQAKSSSKVTVCASNLQQIGAALALYASDHDDLLPSSVGGITRAYCQRMPKSSDCEGFENLPAVNVLLQPYMHSDAIFECPAHVEDGPTIYSPLSIFQAAGTTYEFLDELLAKGTPLTFATQSNRPLAWDHGFNHGGQDATAARVNSLYGDNHIEFQTWQQTVGKIEGNGR